MKIISDIHTHPSLKPYNQKGYVPDNQVDMWREYQENKEYLKQIPSLIKGAIKDMAKFSQANLDKMLAANLQVPFFSIYPVERGMFDLASKHRKWRIQRFLLDLILKTKHYPFLGAVVSGMPLAKVEKILSAVNNNQGIDYFEKETYDEYAFIVEESKKASRQGKKFVLVSDYCKLKDIQENQPNTIAAILTIEGGHSLLHVDKNEDFYKTWDELDSEQKEFLRINCTLNVLRLKGKANDQFTFQNGHTPFFVGLTHMFNNFLVGHAKTFGHGTLVLPGTADLFDQQTGMNDGISPLGTDVMQQLLSRDNGRRVLIDIKHFSMLAREQFYRILEKDYWQKGDQVPIVASHVAVNGFEVNDLYRKDNSSLNSNEYFNRWSINFSNADIRKIHQSGGLLGLVPHEGTMPGPVFKNRLKSLSQKGKRDEYLKLFWGNAFQIVLAVGEKSAWDIISLGSDFDGLMDPFDFYPDTTHLPEMAMDLAFYLDKCSELIVYKKDRLSIIKKKEIVTLMYGYTAQELMDKMFFGNVDRFLSQYFTKAYLEKKGAEAMVP